MNECSMCHHPDQDHEAVLDDEGRVVRRYCPMTPTDATPPDAAKAHIARIRSQLEDQ